MNNRQLKWKIGNNDLKSATMMIEYYNTNGKMGDIIAVPLGNLKPATLLRLSSCSREDLYRVLFDSGVVIYSPVSMSTLMTSNYDDIVWNNEDDKIRTTKLGKLKKVSLSIMRGNDNVFTIDFPNPDKSSLEKLIES